MKVKAIEQGFYGGEIRRAGDVFEVRDGETARWFAPVAEPEAPKPEGKKSGKG